MVAPLIAVAAGAAAMGGGAAMSASNRAKHASRDYRAELLYNLNAQKDAAPLRFGLEQQYQPKYIGLNLSNTEAALAGTQGQMGVIDLLKEYGPQLTDASRSAAGTSELWQSLLADANQQVAAGPNLDPRFSHELTQRIRASQAARGMGFSLPDVGVEGALTADQMDRLRRIRQAFGLQVATSAEAGTVNPLAAGGSVIPGGPVFNPESAYAGSIASQNINAKNAARMANFQAAQKTAGGLMSMGGQVMGAGIGGLGMGGTGGGFVPNPAQQTYSNMYYGGRVPWQLTQSPSLYE